MDQMLRLASAYIDEIMEPFCRLAQLRESPVSFPDATAPTTTTSERTEMDIRGGWVRIGP